MKKKLVDIIDERKVIDERRLYLESNGPSGFDRVSDPWQIPTGVTGMSHAMSGITSGFPFIPPYTLLEKRLRELRPTGNDS